ncbi:hypothetical protein V6N13_022883 [Hibiscus sabdariffa]
MERVSIAKSLVIGKETALSILKKSRKLKQSEHPSQGLHMRRNLAKGDVDLRVGNGARVVALCWDIIRKNEMQRNNKIFMSHQRSMYKYRKQEEELKGLQ